MDISYPVKQRGGVQQSVKERLKELKGGIVERADVETESRKKNDFQTANIYLSFFYLFTA